MVIVKIPKAPLDSWIANRIGENRSALTQEKIRWYQLQRLRETIRRAYRCSPFYRNLLTGFAETDITCLGDLHQFPFTTDDDIRRQGLHFLCVSQDDISRVVTLDSSGTTGAAKRLYFTPSDQELTINFFQYGMAALTEAGDRVLILLPGERAGSVGDLLASALERLGVRPIPYGVVRSLPETLEIMEREEVDSLVGIPVQVLALARYANAVARKSFRLKSVLLSTDHVPTVVASELGRLWGCKVFEHYGMTEMGLGGGTSCAAQSGYHLYEADFYFEIVDPFTGEALPEGQEGEVVVTTLTRKGMPLIRYRTGDISRFLPERCGCGAILQRLERITRRIDGKITLNNNQYFTMADLDEALFADKNVINFIAKVDNMGNATKLSIYALSIGQNDESAELELYQALDTVPAIRLARQAGKLMVLVKIISCESTFTTGTAKRAIAELSEADEEQGNIFDSTWKNST